MSHLKLKDQEHMSFEGHFGTVEVRYHAVVKWFEGVEDPEKFTASLIENNKTIAIGEGNTETQAVQALYQECANIVASKDIQRFI